MSPSKHAMCVENGWAYIKSKVRMIKLPTFGKKIWNDVNTLVTSSILKWPMAKISAPLLIIAQILQLKASNFMRNQIHIMSYMSPFFLKEVKSFISTLLYRK